MWTRKELKTRGKNAFSLNYWKTVLISLIVATIISGVSGATGAAGGSAAGSGAVASSTYNYSIHEGPVVESGDYDDSGNPIDIPESSPEMQEGTPEAQESVNSLPEQIQQFFKDTDESTFFHIAAIALGVILIIVLVVMVIAVLISAFLINPLEVGTKRFFVQNLHEAANVKEIAFGYDHCYKNIVKTMFFRDLYIFLWSLLFIIPGIIKSYEYRMIPYILAEHPDMPKKEVFALSKAMMTGNKWRAFVLELSFILWDLLSLFTFGLLDLFYLNPYKNMTRAALYEALAYGGQQEESVVWSTES